MPGHQDAAGWVAVQVVLVVQGGDDVVAEPAGDGLVFRVGEAVQGFVEAGLVDGVHRFFAAGAVGEAQGSELVGVHALAQAFGVALAEQAADVGGDEPGLSVDKHGAQLVVVTLENDGGECFLHVLTPCQVRTASIAVSRWRQTAQG